MSLTSVDLRKTISSLVSQRVIDDGCSVSMVRTLYDHGYDVGLATRMSSVKLRYRVGYRDISFKFFMFTTQSTYTLLKWKTNQLLDLYISFA